MARMKVVLRQPVDKLGDPGEVVSVSAGYARNFLIPRGLAVAATKGNLKQAQNWANSRSTREAKELIAARSLRSTLETKPVEVAVQAGPDGRLFGSVTSADISEALASQAGAEIDRHKIELEEPIKSLGVHVVRVPLHADVVAEVRVEVTSAS